MFKSSKGYISSFRSHLQKEMAQTSNVVPQYSQGYPLIQQQSRVNDTFVVVNQQPSLREVFPYRLHINWILAFGIAKCILGSLLFITGIVNVAIVRYDTKISFGIWCGLTVGSLLAGLTRVRPIHAGLFRLAILMSRWREALVDHISHSPLRRR